MTAEQLPPEILSWLLEPDASNPGARCFALRDLLDRPPDDAELVDARVEIMRTGPVPAILDAQHPEGYWQFPGPGYSTKYRGTVWQLIQLATFGADPSDSRVRSACEYVLTHTQTSNGGFGARGGFVQKPPPPSAAIHCLNGNLLASLINLGWLDDERVQRAIDWQALSITGDEPSVAYYKSTTAGPGFTCGVNLGQPCAWGANKALRGLLAIPPARRGHRVKGALQAGASFLLSRNPAVADYPYTGKVSTAWQRLGLPLSYWSDVLETLENLADMGFGADSRLDQTFEWLLDKRDADGRWRLENTINGKSWADVEVKGKPSKWVTLRALRTLRRAGRLAEAL